MPDSRETSEMNINIQSGETAVAARPADHAEFEKLVLCNWYFDLTPRHAMVKITTLEPSKARQGKHKGHTVQCKRCKAKQACYAKAKSTRRRRRTLFHKTVSWFIK